MPIFNKRLALRFNRKACPVLKLRILHSAEARNAGRTRACPSYFVIFFLIKGKEQQHENQLFYYCLP